MFSPRELPADVEAVRDRHAPDSPVLDVDADFETLPPAAAEDLGLFVDALAPASYPDSWLPDDAPELLRRYAGPDFTIGLAGGGTVVRTTQTEPPTLLVKKRAETTPDDFLALLIADGLVQIGAEPSTNTADRLPETFLPFFGELYPDLDRAVRSPPAPDTATDDESADVAATLDTGYGPNDAFQVANALFDAWVGLHTREVCAEWEGDHPRLYETWVDAGERLTGRLDGLTGEVARGETDFPTATEYACSAVRHGLDLPAPFDALDTAAYRERGAPYAVKWAEKTFAAMAADE
ncbi:hypothetical protein JCM17823_17760 [Halorubrum gandharaense]